MFSLKVFLVAMVLKHLDFKSLYILKMYWSLQRVFLYASYVKSIKMFSIIDIKIGQFKILIH